MNMTFYKEIFDFPVENYYRKAGFDFISESFEDLSVEFINNYNEALMRAPLVKDAKKTLSGFKKAGKQNVIISAMKQDLLLESVTKNGLRTCFADIIGIDNIFAAGKTSIALQYVDKNNIKKSDIVFIGDTLHDYEVSKAIGCRCILVAHGHQSEIRLRSTQAEVVPALSSLIPS